MRSGSYERVIALELSALEALQNALYKFKTYLLIYLLSLLSRYGTE